MSPGPEPSLADVEVRALDGARLRLSTLWAEQAALIVFLRHFGCPACSRTVTELGPRVAELESLGIDVAGIGPGSSHAARDFLAQHGVGEQGSPTVRLLADPDAAAFRAAGMVRSAWAALGPSGVIEQARLAAQGFVARGPKGDPLWLGGALLVERGGHVVQAWRSRSIAETPRVTELVDGALRLAAARAAPLI